MFTTREYQSDESRDIGKVLNFSGDCYDLLNSPFLNLLNALSIAKYYDITEGSRQLDVISQEIYESPFYVPYIMLYNGLLEYELEENQTINLFDITDFNNLYQEVYLGNFQ